MEEKVTQSAKVKDHYGFFTATAMIIGIVIGSGIFFKSDDVLAYTGGDVVIGILVFCLAAFGIIFGSLTLSELSLRTAKAGGAIGYYEKFVSLRMAAIFGWYQTFVYYPSITVVVAWVAGLYTTMLFGIGGGFEVQVLIGFGYMACLYLINIVSLKFGGKLQNLTTIIKLVPIIVVAIAGIIWGEAAPEIKAGVEVVKKSSVGLGWLAALSPIAFSFDGWIIATSITHEVKNPKKNMTLALIVGPLIVLSAYILYFFGTYKILGAEYILTNKDEAINTLGRLLLGENGTKILLTVVLISILGVVNGVVLGSLRLPQALAEKKMFPAFKKVEKINSRFELSISSSLIAFAIAAFWFLLHYLIFKYEILGVKDISEISVLSSYLFYIILYLKVMKLRKDKIITSNFKGYIAPVLAIIGALIIFFGGISNNFVGALIFVGIYLVISMGGYLSYKKNKSL